MNFRRILVATDGTDASLRGVDVAAQVAQQYGSELLLFTVVSLPQALAANMGEQGISDYVERVGREALAPSLARLRALGIGAEVKIVVGPPAETILAEADNICADLVVMGRRSRMEPKDLVLGSVSD
ncbi:MAG: universal stress protein, partial [Thermoleophilia bacterium]|nr:universal stress protein [Thermoleophilia bacterium]